MKSCRLALLAALLLFPGCQRSASLPRETGSSEPASTSDTPVATTGTSTSVGPVAVDFQNVHFRVAPGVVLEVRRLQGALVSRREGAPPVFDDVSSYRLRIDAGEVAMTPASLTALLNNRTFNYDGAPISDVKVSIEGSRVRQTGTLHKGIPLPFSILAELAATADGRIRLRPVSMKVVKVPATGLMRALHLELDDLVSSNRPRGFETTDNDFLLIAERLLPDPQIAGKLSRIYVEGDRIVQVFGSAPAGRGDGAAKNYQHFRGHLLQFGRLTMTNTDLRLIDADPSDPFDFSPREYVSQLVAGYSKNAADGSLRVYMPDYNEARR